MVTLLQQRLLQLGCGPLEVDGDFGKQTEAAVRQFQMRFADQDGLPLKIDGEVGSLTWAALFGQQSVSQTLTPQPGHPLLVRMLQLAAAEVGVLEEPPGSNRGARVDQYITRTGLNPNAGNFAWCMCFVYWCFDEAAKQLKVANPCIKTAGVRDHWTKAKKKGIRTITPDQAVQEPALVRPGQLFCLYHSATTGHIGIVESVIGGKLTTIEGNTNTGGSREGIGVFRRTLRPISSVNLGFIDYNA
ncbi:peptidoglycan-binding protein [Hymenobacter busanensis]|uniref:peptidoglycan-binding protein n=1 Tax=Hymenobacter busanensis TaxID=2607656 RepID=UPI00191BEAD5|nr:peptidoglycan-binding protein [Hymenobacter busanensis]